MICALQWTHRMMCTALLTVALLAPGCAGHRGADVPEDPHQPAHGRSSYDFLMNSASVDTTPPEDEELRPPTIAEEPVLPAYPPEALAGNAGPSTVAVRIMVDSEGLVAEVADSPRLPSTPGPFAPQFRQAVETVLAEWRFWPAVWRRYEPGEDLDGDGVADYRRVVETRAVNFYLDVRFDFEIVDGRGLVTSDQGRPPAA